MGSAFIASLENINASGDFLLRLVEAMSCSSRVQDIKTGKYLLANKYQASNHGCDRVEEVLDVSWEEICIRRRQKIANLQGSLVLEDEHEKFIRMKNDEASASKTSIKFQKAVLLASTGFVFVEQQIKVPVLGKNQKNVAIFSFSEEITREVNLASLYYLYKKHYSKKRAIQQFLRYLDVGQYFVQSPTDSEVLTLLGLYQNSVYKIASTILHLKLRTVEVHVRHLREKLGSHQNLQSLLRAIRNVGYKNTIQFI